MNQPSHSAANNFGSAALLRVALPLIASVACFSVTLFTDRTLLLWFDPIASGAAIAAGNLYWAFACLPVTAMGFVTPLVAQAAATADADSADDQIAQLIRQSVWLTLLVAPFYIIPGIFAEEVFLWAGHDHALVALEATYFRTLMLLVPASMLEAGLSAYFVGRRKTRPVLLVNIATSVLNIALDVLLIFGVLGFPELGILGAAIATVVAAWMKVTVYGGMICSDRGFYSRLRSSYRLSLSTISQIALPGLAVGFQNQIRTTVFSGVLMAIGAMSALSLAASSATFTVYQLLGIPVIGLASAVTVFAGQASNSGNPELLQATVRSSFAVAGGYALVLATVMLLLPEWVLWPVAVGMEPDEVRDVVPLAATFMTFAAFYCLAETVGMVAGSVIKGVGRTSLMLLTTAGCSAVGYGIVRVMEAEEQFGTDDWWLALVLWSASQAVILTLAVWRHTQRTDQFPSAATAAPDHTPSAASGRSEKMEDAAACSVTS